MIPVCQKATRYTNKSVPTGPTSVPNVKCAKVNHTYQNSLVAQCTKHCRHIPSVPKCNWCTKRNDCNGRSENDQEWSLCARIWFYAFPHRLLKEPIISPLKFKMVNGRHIENRSTPYFFVFLLHFVFGRAAAFVSSPIHLFYLTV